MGKLRNFTKKSYTEYIFPAYNQDHSEPEVYSTSDQYIADEEIEQNFSDCFPVTKRKSMKTHKKKAELCIYKDSALYVKRKRAIFSCHYCSHIDNHFMHLLLHIEKSHTSIDTAQVYEKSVIDKIRQKLRNIYRKYFMKPAILLDVQPENTTLKQTAESLNEISKTSIIENKTLPVAQRKSYICSICNFKFISSVSLQFHLHHHGDKEVLSYFCSDCNQKFLTRDALEKHSRSNSHNEKGHLCSECQDEFKTDFDLNQHNLKNHIGKSIASEHSLDLRPQQSIRSTSNMKPEIYCHECNREFKTKDGLKQHRKSSIHNQNHECLICEKLFFSKDALEQHMKSKKHSAVQYLCSMCKKEFKTDEALESHKTNTGHYAYFCTECHLEFKTNFDLIQHNIWNHSQSRTTHKTPEQLQASCSQPQQQDKTDSNAKQVFSCVQCNRDFESNYDLKQHRKSSIHKESYECTTCEKLFASEDALRQHMTSKKHNMKHVCYICKKEFNTRNSLDQHMQNSSHRPLNTNTSIHPPPLMSLPTPKIQTVIDIQQNPIYPSLQFWNIKPSHTHLQHKCSLCLSEFPTNGQLEAHIKLIHKRNDARADTESTVDFACPGCSSKFFSKKILKKHMFLTGHKVSVPCKICGAVFGSTEALSRHMSSSVHKKPKIQCVTCQNKFKSKLDLKNHMQCTGHN